MVDRLRRDMYVPTSVIINYLITISIEFARSLANFLGENQESIARTYWKTIFSEVKFFPIAF